MRDLIRRGDWWEHKLIPIVCTFYATALHIRVPIASIWTAGAAILLSIVPCAAFVSVLNDVTDRRDDLAAGKPNRLADVPPAAIAALFAAAIVPGLYFAWHWRGDMPLLLAYAGSWIAFSLYSLAPFRFKARGILGVVCDAAGALGFPVLLAVLLTFRDAHRHVDMTWVVSIVVWAVAFGLRGILWHQLHDVTFDRAAGVGTFAVRHPRSAESFGKSLAFLIEIAMLALIAWQLRSEAMIVAIVLYTVFIVQRYRRTGTAPVIVVPAPHTFTILHEYYIVFMPIALLLAASIRHHRDVLILGAHLVLFFPAVVRTIELCVVMSLPPAVRAYLRRGASTAG